MTNKELFERAKNLTMNGQNSLADDIYEQLLFSEPNNDEYLFSKAVNIGYSNPELAILLFKKVIEVNPQVENAYRNIIVAANVVGKFTLALDVFNDLIVKYPKKIKILYYRAACFKESGDYLKALLEFYKVIERSAMKNNPKLFRDHQIFDDILSCKIELRNQTNSKPSPYIANKEQFEGVKMKVYQYHLPMKVFGNENFLIEFGKMMGMTIKEILEVQPDYIPWCILNLNNFCVSEDVIELIKHHGVVMSNYEEVNLFKLQQLEDLIPYMELEEGSYSYDESTGILKLTK